MIGFKMKKLTVAQFNKEFGKNTWGYETYKIATNNDINTFVAKKEEGYTIPYFCEWIQSNTLKGIKELHKDYHSEIIQIVKETK